MKIKITADSTCDLSPELCEKYNITISPLSVTINGHDYKDGVDVTPEIVFRAVEDAKKVQTAAVNQFEYEELFSGLLKEYDAIFLGAVGFPGVPDHISLRELLLVIRKGFDEYVNVRPVRLLEGAPCPLAGVKREDITQGT